MPSGPTLSLARAPALEAAGLVGAWTTDVAAGRSLLEPGAAALLAGDADLAGRPLPLEVALARIHPEDRDRTFALIRRSRVAGGPFAAEFRVLDAGGGVRWVLNRGGALPGAVGLRGGIYLDVTDTRRNLAFPSAGPEALSGEPGDPLAAAAEHGARVHAAAAASGCPLLLLTAELLLLEIGRALAGRH